MARLRRHRHVLNHHRLLTCSLGEFVPVSCVEVLFGDSFRQMARALVRFSPLVRPVMHPVRAEFQHWYIPTRLVWPEFEEMITGRGTPDFPTVAIDGTVGGLHDHLGLPPSAAGLEVNAFTTRCYNLVFNEFVRDQNLDAEVSLDSTVLQHSRWQKEYFTLARDEPQQGPEISIPFNAGQVPVLGVGNISTSDVGPVSNVKETGGGTTTYPNAKTLWNSGGHFRTDPDGFPEVYADLSDASGAISVRDLWTAEGLQRFAQRRSRFGERYTDLARYHGITPADSRLQRPEFLGGGRQTIAFSEVLATAESDGVNIGELKGHGIAALRSRPYRRFFSEHGFVLTTMTLRPKVMYQEFLARHYMYKERADYWTQELENVGQQEVWAREVQATEPDAEKVFGYVDPYEQYRRHPSSVSGVFRTTQQNWHFARKFEGPAAPGLNAGFVTCDPRNDPFASQTEPQLQIMSEQLITAQRLVKKRAA